MKNIDATSGKILPERKKKRGGRSQNQHQPATTIDGGEGGIHQKWCHLIHFQGWNSRHDKWMCETNVFHDTPENRVRVGNSSANNKVVKTAAPSSSSKQPKKTEEKKKKKNSKKRGRSKDANDNDNEDEDIDGSMMYQNNLQLIKEACTLPFTLQTKLVDDHDKITKPVYPPPFFNNNNNDKQVLNRRGITMLHEIPSSMNIIDVIKEYMNEKKREDVQEFANEQQQEQQQNDGDDSKKKSGNNDGKGNQTVSTSDTKDNIQTIATRAELKLRKKKRKRFAGNLVSLVDLSLPIFLLYKEEQEQFATYISDQGGSANNEDVDGKDQTTDNVDKKRPSAMYGAEHLLRFFIKLPFILSQYDRRTKAEESAYILTSKEESQEFAERISELVIFLQKNLGCFKAKYIAVEC